MNVRAPPAAEIVTDPRRQRQILIAMCTALVAVVGSVSILNVAQQDLAVDLGASQSELLWIINGFTMALAALLLPIGAIGDRWGRKPVLLAGLGLFIGANAVAALAGTVEVLLAARIMAGVAAAMIMPVTLSVITTSFPPDRRARAVGIWTGLGGARSRARHCYGPADLCCHRHRDSVVRARRSVHGRVQPWEAVVAYDGKRAGVRLGRPCQTPGICGHATSLLRPGGTGHPLAALPGSARAFVSETIEARAATTAPVGVIEQR